MYEIIFLGIIISIIYYELTDISPGGIIVPGAMVFYINQPERMLYTVLIAVVTYYIIKLLSHYLIIFGKRKYSLTLLVAIILNLVFIKIIGLLPFLMDVSLIGYIIPGIISNDFSKQGITKTVFSLGIVVIILKLIMLMLV